MSLSGAASIACFCYCKKEEQSGGQPSFLTIAPTGD
jgi:hypothetical protein